MRNDSPKVNSPIVSVAIYTHVSRHPRCLVMREREREKAGRTNCHHLNTSAAPRAAISSAMRWMVRPTRCSTIGCMALSDVSEKAPDKSRRWRRWNSTSTVLNTLSWPGAAKLPYSLGSLMYVALTVWISLTAPISVMSTSPGPTRTMGPGHHNQFMFIYIAKQVITHTILLVQVVHVAGSLARQPVKLQNLARKVGIPRPRHPRQRARENAPDIT